MAKVLKMLEKLGFVERTEQSTDTAGPTTPETAPKVADVDPAHGAEESPPPPEVRRIRSIEFEEAIAEKATQAEQPENFPFSKIYESAGVSEPEHGFTVFALIEMMDASEFEDLDDQTRARVIRGLLRNLPSGPVAVEDIVNDAAQRDQALDAFERFLADRVAKVEDELSAENEALQLEIDELVIKNTQLMDANRARITEEHERLESWQQRKRAEEDRLFEAVRPFAVDNPVSRDED